MGYTEADHTWAICAYQESRYLRDCLESLKGQTVQSRLLIATSTPNTHIEGLAKEYGIPVYVNSEGNGIGSDWNFAYGKAKTSLVTIAHQDDIYEPEYTERMLKDINTVRKPIIWFCGYTELRNGLKVYNNTNLRIKRLMLFPLKGPLFRNCRFIRRRILSLGCPICCPAVTYVKDQTGKEEIFSSVMKVSLDWDQWEKQSQKKGAFYYRPEPMMSHRVHEESATTKLIASNIRAKEDLEMFSRFWPDWIAKRLSKAYAKSEESNEV